MLLRQNQTTLQLHSLPKPCGEKCEGDQRLGTPDVRVHRKPTAEEIAYRPTSAECNLEDKLNASRPVKQWCEINILSIEQEKIEPTLVVKHERHTPMIETNVVSTSTLAMPPSTP